MKAQLSIIEQFLNSDGNNPIWVSFVLLSDDECSATFNGEKMVLENDKFHSQNNHYSILPISKSLLNSERVSSRKIYIDKEVQDVFLEYIGEDKIDLNRHVLVAVTSLSTKKIEGVSQKLIYRSPKTLSLEQVHQAIEILIEKEKITQYRRAKRSYTKRRIRFEGELDRRKKLKK